MTTESVTLELPTPLTQRARWVARQSQRRMEDVLAEWLGQAETPPIESLPDEQVLAFYDSQLAESQPAELSDLLASKREGALSQTETDRLAALMQIYRQGLVRKARAIKVAVERGLRPPLH